MEPQQPTTPLTLFQTRFVRAVQEAQPSINFALYRRFVKRAGPKLFCDNVLKALTNTIAAGMSNRHSLRAAELGGCIIAYCGGQSLVSTLLMQCIPLFDFVATKTLFYGQLVAYLAVISAALSGLHLIPDEPSYEKS